jgi:hypothetical protein
MWKIKLAVVTLQTIIVLAHDKGFLWSRVQKYFKKLFGIQKPELTTNSTVDLLPKVLSHILRKILYFFNIVIAI